MTSTGVHQYGERSVLIDVDRDQAAATAALLRDLWSNDVVDVVPAEDCVLVTFNQDVEAGRIAEQLPDIEVGTSPASGDLVTIHVRYDGADLAHVAQAAGMTPAEVIAAHTQTEFHVAFCGFAPGFAYLAGLPEPLHLPRLQEPRTHVPAGSVAIAAGYSAIYPRATPGGWLLLGTTVARMFDPMREPPALLTPGTRVRFEAQDVS